MGGKDLFRGRGLIISDCRDASDAEDSERVGDLSSAGTFFDAAVDGLISCSGDGSRLIETDCMAEAISDAGFEAIVFGGQVSSVRHWILFPLTSCNDHHK